MLCASLVKETGKDYYEWNISLLNDKIEYPALINLCEGDEFGLPMPLPTGSLDDEI